MKKKLDSFLKALFNPHDYFSILSRNRYKSLKIRIVLLDAMLSLLPLFIVVTISYFWFQHILKEDFRNQVKWQIENTTQSIEFFIDEKVSALRFLASSYTFEQLSDQKMLNDIFRKFEKEFPGLVDLGVIDSNGIQQSYAGPYPLTGKDYSNQEWFNEVVVRNVYVSDVFMGYRRLPHFAIAVKKDCPENRTFCIIRATIDMKTLKRFASNINLRENDDAFVINHDGILQTPSQVHGNVLERFSLPSLPSQQGVSVLDIKEPEGGRAIFGYEPIENSPWILVAIIKSTPYSRIPKIFRNELLLIGIGSVLIGVAVTFLMAQTVVNRIKKADQETEDAMAKTEQASKLASIGRLAAGVAHEINNPLAIINEKAGLVKDLLELSGDVKDKEKLLALINGIFDSVNRCSTITHRLLGFARRMETTHEVLDLNDIVKEVIGFLEKEILFRNIRLELNLAEGLPKIESDKGQLQQVFLNIINNAVDAIEEGGLIEVSTRVKDKNTVLVSIRDTGSGIPKDKLKSIFEPFYTTKEKGEGTGLGLFISYGIIKKLGGIVLVESEVNKGTTFTVELPISAEAV
ncbi:MAG TPA: ATP-binding protein [Thermodesulfovibrionales bacterium]|nr:ATP-binding protein [Thermodesulfovibrionales bacterium]